MTQKPPKFTGTVDLEDEDAGLPEHGHEPLAHEEHEHDAAAPEADEYADDEGDDLDSDLDDQMAARKRQGQRIFYGAIVAFGLLIVFIGYQQFAPMFHRQATNTPVAVKAPVATPPASKVAANTNNTLPPPALNPASGINPGAAPIPAMPGAATGNNPAAGSAMPDSGGVPALPGAVNPSQMPAGAMPVGQGQPVPFLGGQPQPGSAGMPAMPTPAGTPPATANPALPVGSPSPTPGQMPANPVPGPNLNPAMAMKPMPVPGTAMPASSAAAGAGLMPPASAFGTQAGNPAQPGQGSQMPAPQMQKPAMASVNPTAVSGSDPRIEDLASKVASLQASQKVTAGQLQQIQASLDALQKQIGQVSVTPTRGRAAGVAESAPAKPAAAPHRVHRAVTAEAIAPVSHRGSLGWVLRSATPSGALLGHSSTGELQRVAVGDVVTGLGRITYIGERNGRWVVQGSNGSVEE
jgi:hypothetical protein